MKRDLPKHRATGPMEAWRPNVGKMGMKTYAKVVRNYSMKSGIPPWRNGWTEECSVVRSIVSKAVGQDVMPLCTNRVTPRFSQHGVPRVLAAASSSPFRRGHSVEPHGMKGQRLPGFTAG